MIREPYWWWKPETSVPLLVLLDILEDVLRIFVVPQPSFYLFQTILIDSFIETFALVYICDHREPLRPIEDPIDAPYHDIQTVVAISFAILDSVLCGVRCGKSRDKVQGVTEDWGQLFQVRVEVTWEQHMRANAIRCIILNDSFKVWDLLLSDLLVLIGLSSV